MLALYVYPNFDEVPEAFKDRLADAGFDQKPELVVVLHKELDFLIDPYFRRYRSIAKRNLDESRFLYAFADPKRTRSRPINHDLRSSSPLSVD